jgi:integrase
MPILRKKVRFKMETEPIRDQKKIAAMRKILRAGPFGPRNELLFILGINSALRIGDLLRLTFGDTFDGRGKTKEAMAVREQKTGKQRKTPLNKTAKEVLKGYREHLTAIGDEPGPGEPLFQSRKGGRAITRQQAHAIMSKAGRDVGLSNIGTHSLRKTFGYHVFKRSGGNLALTQKLLNHSSSGDTLRYIGIDREQMDSAFFELNLG